MAKISIFVSHKEKDEKAARFLKEELESHGGGNLTVHIMEELLPGEEWRLWIKKHLVASNLLVLLFTDTTAEWDWCLYEAGLFTDLKGGDNTRKVVCIHSPHHNAPDQLLDVQACRGTPEAIQNFLTALLVETTYLAPDESDAINPKIKPSAIKATAEQLSSLLTGKRESLPYVRQLTIRVADPTAMKEDGIPRDAKIEDPDGDALDLFAKKQGKGWLWQDLEKVARTAADTDWLGDLSKVLCQASRKEKVRPIQKAYRPPHKKNEWYRPILHHVDWLTNNSIDFHVVFADEPVLEKDTLARPVSSFGDLMSQLEELIESTPSKVIAKVLSNTPALGFLARSADEWERLRSCLEHHSRQLAITCLEAGNLAVWHDSFIGRQTDRGGVISADLANEATRVSEALLKKAGATRRLTWKQLPEYYLFNNPERAIIVTPFFLPSLDEPDSEEVRKTRPKVEMFGLVTNDAGIVSQVERVQAHYSTLG